MREVYIKYNPYTIRTKFIIDGEEVDKSSEFFEKQDGVRLQEWIEENGDWKGLFCELNTLMNYSGDLKVTFCGTELDFLDIKEASEKYGYRFKSINFKYIAGENHNDKLKDLKELYEELKEGPVEEVKTQKIKENFEAAISSEFEIVVVAPMSSGKSTLINSILSKDLLPAINQATTATITRIKHNQSCKEFLVNCEDKNGNVLAKDKVATLQLIDELNKRAKEINEINIKGNIKNIHSDKINIVFVDTPGGNNSQDREHEKVMRRAIADEKKGMILFVFNYTQLETEDCDRILNYISQAMKNTSLGKQARDRFIFVCNKMDAQDIEREPYKLVKEKLIAHLKKFNIKEPNIFLTCADAAKLVRMSYEDKDLENFSESEEDRLDGYLKPFNRPSRQLFKYASMPESQKKKYQDEVDAIRNSGEKKSTRVVEINSGIPILEDALSQYIEKYAIAIKVKNIHDVFMSKVNEQKMIANCRQSWVESDESFKGVQEEIIKKRKDHENSKKLKDFKDKIKKINIDYKKIEKISEDILLEIREIPSSYPESIKETEADELIKRIEKDLNSYLVKAKGKLETSFEDEFYIQCKNLLKEFKSYIKDLEKDGLLNIGEFNFKNLDDYNELELEELIKEYTEEGVVGTEIVKKKGIGGFFKRLFNRDSGWEERNIYGTIINIKELVRDEISILSNNILDEIEEQIEETKRKESRVKNEVELKLGNIDTLIKEKFDELEEETKNKEALEKIVKENLEKYKWIERFVEKMDSILEV